MNPTIRLTYPLEKVENKGVVPFVYYSHVRKQGIIDEDRLNIGVVDSILYLGVDWLKLERAISDPSLRFDESDGGLAIILYTFRGNPVEAGRNVIHPMPRHLTGGSSVLTPISTRLTLAGFATYGELHQYIRRLKSIDLLFIFLPAP